MTEHKWHVKPDYPFRVFITEDIFFSPTWQGQIANEHMAEIALQMAAAPDLLKAMEDLASYCAKIPVKHEGDLSIPPEGWHVMQVYVSNAYAAIAKARGESQ